MMMCVGSGPGGRGRRDRLTEREDEVAVVAARLLAAVGKRAKQEDVVLADAQGADDQGHVTNLRPAP